MPRCRSLTQLQNLRRLALQSEQDQNQISRDQIVYYTIEDGDTVSKIADEFGISPNTLLWANSLSSVDYIKAGQRLEILPTDGIKYTVKQGDTLSLIAQKYKTDAEEIIAYNNLPADGRISSGDALILPGGRPYIPPAPPAPKKNLYAQKPPAISSTAPNKYFIFPASGRISQGLHGYNGVDIASQCGTPIYEAADGVIASLKTTTSRARLGASVYSGYGNHLMVTHPNGAVTLYAHLRQLFVAEDSSIKQGDVIALMGGGFEYVNGKPKRVDTVVVAAQHDENVSEKRVARDVLNKKITWLEKEIVWIGPKDAD